MNKEAIPNQKEYFAPMTHLAMYLISAALTTGWYTSLYYGPLLESGHSFAQRSTASTALMYAVPILVAVTSQIRNRRLPPKNKTNTVMDKVNPSAFGIAAGIVGSGLSIMITAPTIFVVYAAIVGCVMLAAVWMTLFVLVKLHKKDEPFKTE